MHYSESHLKLSQIKYSNSQNKHAPDSSLLKEMKEYRLFNSVGNAPFRKLNNEYLGSRLELLQGGIRLSDGYCNSVYLRIRRRL